MLIKKTPVGESDIFATLFTKEFGKLRAVAKNAVSSRKRFGGSLEMFSLLKVELGSNRSGGEILQSSEVLESFAGVAKDMRIFLKANCLVELIDAAFTEDKISDEKIFTAALKSLSAMSRGSGSAAFLNFQKSALESLGYGMEFQGCDRCGLQNPGRGILVFPAGIFLCGECAGKSHEKSARKFNCAEVIKGDLAMENVICFNSFFQYQTGKVLKSAKVLENMLFR